MSILNIAILLLAAPVVSQPEAAQPRMLWWHHVENAWNTVVDGAAHIWNSFGLNNTFPALTDALESFVSEGWQFINDLKNGVTGVWQQFQALGQNIVAGYDPNGDWLANVQTIIANVNQVVDCSTDTFELLVDVKCDADTKALEAALLSLWNAKSNIDNRIESIDVVDVHDECPESGAHRMEIEFDVRVRGEGIDSAAMNTFINDTLKPELVKKENWNIATETSLAPFLPALDDSFQFVVNLQPDFCEAWDAGATEFTEATATLEELRQRVNELTEEFNAARQQVSWWWRMFWSWNKQGELDDARNSLQSAENNQEHGAKTVMGTMSKCINHQVHGPQTEAGRFCDQVGGGRRRMQSHVQRVLV